MTGTLLCQRDLLLRERSITVRVAYLPGNNKVLADAALRQWDLTDTTLLEFFKLHLPQQHSWRIFQVPPDVNQKITSVLCGGRTKTESAHAVQEPALPPGENVFNYVP